MAMPGRDIGTSCLVALRGDALGGHSSLAILCRIIDPDVGMKAFFTLLPFMEEKH